MKLAAVALADLLLAARPTRAQPADIAGSGLVGKESLPTLGDP